MPNQDLTFTRALADLAVGEAAVVCALDGGSGLAARLAAMGVSPGARIVVLQNRGAGPLLARVRDTRIALGRREAARILVQAEGADGSG
jgi:ferrous iron transport protein A